MGEEPQPVARSVAGEIDENVDTVGADDIRGFGVAHVVNVAHSVATADLTGYFVGGRDGGVAEYFKFCMIVLA